MSWVLTSKTKKHLAQKAFFTCPIQQQDMYEGIKHTTHSDTQWAIFEN